MSQLPPTRPPKTQPTAGLPADSISRPDQRSGIGGELSDIESQPLIRNFAKAFENADTAEALFQSIFDIVAAETDILAMWRVQVDVAEQTMRSSAISDDNANAVWLSVESQIAAVINRSREFDQICSVLTSPDKKHIIVAAPLDAGLSNADSREILTACFAANDQSMLRLQWLMGIASQSVCQWAQQRQLTVAQTHSKSLNDVLQLLDAINASKNTTEAAIAISNNFRRLFKANQVAIAQVDARGNTKLLAVSDVEKMDAGAASNQLMLSAIKQSVTTATAITFPNQDPAVDRASILPLENWCQSSNAPAGISLPMNIDDGSIVGSLLVTLDSEAQLDQQRAYIERMVSLISKQFDVVSRANQSAGELFKSKLKKGKSITSKVIIGALICAGLLAVPMPYRVKCECQIQPTQRRFVAAPYNGVLEKSLVEVGQIVAKDQVIATLEGRQLRIELAGLEADFKGAKRRRDSSLAKREIAQSQIAKSEMKGLSAKIQLLNDRIKNLDVRSPIDGVIVAGDLEKAQGAPLEMGQNLFEVAPLETMVAEIGIPESEIHYVKQEDSVALKINSFPYQTWSGKVQRIHPRAEVVSDETVFIAEVEIDNAAGELRPGMEGNAKISTRWSPLGWNLFHNAWESVRYWTIW